jgi:hypothetical protein
MRRWWWSWTCRPLRNLLSLLLILGLAGAALTALGAGAARWFDERRRLGRLVRRSLGGEPDGMIIARGRGAAAGFRLAGAQMVVMRDGGADALLYPLRALVGAEVIVDDQVVARVARDEPRRSLDQIAGAAEGVTLRLVFDDARHPDFELDLWPPRDRERRDAPSAAIREARSWLARVEALLRRTPAAAVRHPPSAQGPEDDGFDEDDYEDPSGGDALP